MNPIMECKNLTKKFGNLEAVSNIDLTLEKGRIIGLLGPNGSGKTTLIKMANGLLSPTNGQILVNGMNVGTHTKEIISYLPEKTYLNSWMKVCDVIDFFGDFYSNFDKVKAYEMLKRLNINSNDRLKTMSKGTKEKVQLILVMSRDAELFVLDEPIGGVDPAARDYILSTILNNYKENGTILISTHLISDIEKILDDIVFIQNGKIVRTSSVDDIRSQEGKSIDSLFREVFKC